MTLKELENHSETVLSRISEIPAKYELQIEDNTVVKTVISKQGGLIETKEGDFYPAYALQNIKFIGE